MSYIRRLQKAVEYIEDNIKEDITLEDVAAKSGFSKFHFCRIFKALTDNTVEDYIRKRRLTLASAELIQLSKSIIDIALDYGYNSQEAFTRAFKDTYRITPKAYRKRGFELTYAAKVVLSPAVIELNQNVGEKPLIPQKTELAAFTVAGFGRYELKFGTKTKAWSNFDQNEHRITNIVNKGIYYGLHLPGDSPRTSSQRYMACVGVNDLNGIGGNLVGEVIPANQYAVFKIPSVPEFLNKTILSIYQKWLPEYGLEPVGNYSFEYFDGEYCHNDPGGALYYYIPVR